jgi:hypothetical protein
MEAVHFPVFPRPFEVKKESPRRLSGKLSTVPLWATPPPKSSSLNSMAKQPNSDSDVNKGAVEEGIPSPDKPKDDPNLHGQLGHRDQNEMIKDADSDLPG